MAPLIEFATAADGTRIAWTATGHGPSLVLMPGVPLSNLEAEWRIPTLDRAYRRLAARVRLIQYDGRGTGRSQRDVQDVSLAAQLLDLDAVLASARVVHVVLLGFYHSSMTALAWAARHPDRVRGVIIFGGAARGWDPMRDAGTQALLSLIERDWDTFAESATHAWLGWPDDAEGRLAADWFRTSTSPAIARATLQAASETDVQADLEQVIAPTLILHRADAPVIPLAVSQALVEALPDGRLEILPGSSASLFFEATDLVVERLATFTLDPAGPAPAARSSRGAVAPPTTGPLSPREREVLALVARGETNGQIAAALGLSINTVERHVSNLYRKIDVRGRAEATAWAIRNGVA
jgi:pimeloyl-ACP methyl ester carboxylesterase/DNA-binding CsgD family transcriptional regulator